MRVCLLTDELPEDFDPAPYLKDHEWEMVTMKAPVMENLKAIADQNHFDIYLNICEGYEDDGEDDQFAYEGIEVIRALEQLNLPYTGANERFYDPTREEMQAVADVNGVGFAKGYRVRSAEEAERLVRNLRFPIMVKHPQSYGSTGMFRESRVDTFEQLRPQVERMCAEFGAARMEEFIVGSEFNVFVVENPDDFNDPYVYPPTQLIFPPGEEFWHTDIKWDFSVPFDFKRVDDPVLIARLQDMGRRMFLAMQGIGYGRCDIRMNEQGELFILEINPNGAIMLKPEEYGPADYMILYDKDGYKGFFDRIFRSALIRHKMKAGMR
jgi:D-alanine-D-alanine ligase